MAELAARPGRAAHRTAVHDEDPADTDLDGDVQRGSRAARRAVARLGDPGERRVVVDHQRQPRVDGQGGEIDRSPTERGRLDQPAVLHGRSDRDADPAYPVAVAVMDAPQRSADRGQHLPGLTAAVPARRDLLRPTVQRGDRAAPVRLAQVDGEVTVGLAIAGLGVAALYPILLAVLVSTPGLPDPRAAALGTLASGTAVLLAPAGLALLGSALDLRLAFPVAVLPLLAALAATAVPATVITTRRTEPPGGRR